MAGIREWFGRTLWRIAFGPVGRMVPFDAWRHVARPAALATWGLGLRRDVIGRNLALAFAEKSMSDRDRIGRESLVNLFTVGLELLSLRHLSPSDLSHSLTIENLGLLTADDGRGRLLLSGHVGNWELLAFGAAALSGRPFSIIVKSQKDYGELTRTRTAVGNSIIPTHRAAREAASILARGGSVAMLADQAATSEEELTTMFGIPTYTFSAPARLALRFRPRVIIGFAARRDDGGYHVRLEELPHDDLPDNAEGRQALSQRYVERLEQVIRQHPEQWLWGHRKWKNSPEITY